MWILIEFHILRVWGEPIFQRWQTTWLSKPIPLNWFQLDRHQQYYHHGSEKARVQRTNPSFKINNKRIPMIRIWLLCSCYFEHILIHKFSIVLLNFKKDCHHNEVHEQNRRWKAMLWPVQQNLVWRTDALLDHGQLAAWHCKLSELLW